MVVMGINGLQLNEAGYFFGGGTLATYLDIGLISTTTGNSEARKLASPAGFEPASPA